MRIPVFQVDVFTDQPFKGNPAAVCPLSVWLDDLTMRKVASENNLSATAFFVPVGEAYEIRWFTSLCEIRLCGHATVATAFVLSEILREGPSEVSFKTQFSGDLTVRREGNLFCLELPRFEGDPLQDRPSALVEALGTLPAASEVFVANSTYFAVFENERMVRDFHPNFALIEGLHPMALAITAPGENVDYVLRYFAPSYGVTEDPATGSAQSALVPYWSKRLNKQKLRARQLSERGGDFWCEMANQKVLVRGQAVLTMKATLEI